MVTKEEFNKVWSESTTEDILNQFYYEHNDLRELLKENGNKEEVITQLTNHWNELEEWIKNDKEKAMVNFECGRCFNMFDILDKMKEIKGGNKK